MNILIVDDHPLFRHALIQAVRYSIPQAQIQETADVDEFYEKLEHGSEPDLVLLDLNLPGASGFSALVYVRAQYPAIPIIVVSAHEEVSIIQRAIAHGAMGYIPKSSHPSHIGEAIKHVLEVKFGYHRIYQNMLDLIQGLLMKQHWQNVYNHLHHNSSVY
jgi:DNA-binding NarL/FixJ family response regulator